MNSNVESFLEAHTNFEILLKEYSGQDGIFYVFRLNLTTDTDTTSYKLFLDPSHLQNLRKQLVDVLAKVDEQIDKETSV